MVKIEVERSFSYKWRIHNWLRNNMSTDLIEELAVIPRYGWKNLILGDCFKTSKVCWMEIDSVHVVTK